MKLKECRLYIVVIIFLNLVFGVFQNIPVLAKRGPAPEVEPVHYNGMLIKASEKMGYIEAFDQISGERLWQKKVYDVSIDSALETDVQWVFIRSLSINDDRLIVVDERGATYFLDLMPHEIGSKVTFKLVGEDGELVTDWDVCIFDRDLEMKAAADHSLYACDEKATTRAWFLTKLKTDNQGRLLLDFNTLKVRKLRFQLAAPYKGVEVERSSDLSHTFSDRHIRVIRFKSGSTTVERNDIYDLGSGTVSSIQINGEKEESLFGEINLVVPRSQ